jgi:hypothetical protein
MDTLMLAYMIHLCTFQDSKNTGSLSSLSSMLPSSSLALQDVDGTGVVKYSKFLAVTIKAHGVISEEHLMEVFNQIVLWWCTGLTSVMLASLQDCDDSGYISTVDNLASI